MNRSNRQVQYYFVLGYKYYYITIDKKIKKIKKI